MKDGPAYRLTFRAEGDGPPAILRVRRLLKAALRGYGLRCEAVEEIPQIRRLKKRQQGTATATENFQAIPQNQRLKKRQPGATTDTENRGQ